MDVPTRMEAPRFTVRCWQTGDGQATWEAIEASRDHLATWMAWVSEARSPAELEIHILELRDLYFRDEAYFFGVFSPDGTEVLGGCGFHLREGPLLARQAEIGMWIHAEQAGRGRGTELLEALLAWGFTAWPWLRLSWTCDTRNVASRRVAEKAGLRLEGVLRGQWDAVSGGRRDTAVYAILKEEWAKRTG